MELRLKARRLELGLTLEEMAQRVGSGVSVSQLSRWERGESSMPTNKLPGIAAAYEMPVAAIFGGAAAVSGVRRVPLVGEIATGNWREAVEAAEGMVIAPEEVGPNSFALRPIGDSMDLLIGSADGYLIIDPDQTDLIEGKVYAVMNGDGETTVKEFRSNPARLVPRSSNPVHREISIGKEGFSVIGRAVCKVDPM